MKMDDIRGKGRFLWAFGSLHALIMSGCVTRIIEVDQAKLQGYEGPAKRRYDTQYVEHTINEKQRLEEDLDSFLALRELLCRNGEKDGLELLWRYRTSLRDRLLDALSREGVKEELRASGVRRFDDCGLIGNVSSISDRDNNRWIVVVSWERGTRGWSKEYPIVIVGRMARWKGVCRIISVSQGEVEYEAVWHREGNDARIKVGDSVVPL